MNGTVFVEELQPVANRKVPRMFQLIVRSTEGQEAEITIEMS